MLATARRARMPPRESTCHFSWLDLEPLQLDLPGLGLPDQLHLLLPRRDGPGVVAARGCPAAQHDFDHRLVALLAHQAGTSALDVGLHSRTRLLGSGVAAARRGAKVLLRASRVEAPDLVTTLRLARLQVPHRRFHWPERLRADTARQEQRASHDQEVASAHGGYKTLPGFIMPWGSSVRLIARIMSSSSALL